MPEPQVHEHEKASRVGVTGFMVAANYFPLVYILTGAALVFGLPFGPWGRVGLALSWIYLLPPLVGRLLVGIVGAPVTENAAPQARSYKLWWMLTQLQMLFNRLPVLEELLRLLPGVYPLWLNLWGSHVSLLAFWAPGARVTDRYLLEVGRGVVLGTRCLVGGHLVTRHGSGDYRLTVARVVVESGAVIGVQAVIGPGCRICSDETVPAGALLPPFTMWKNGHKRRLEPSGAP